MDLASRCFSIFLMTDGSSMHDFQGSVVIENSRTWIVKQLRLYSIDLRGRAIKHGVFLIL